MTERVAIGVGSNRGDPVACITEAFRRLQSEGLRQARCSSLYRTAPVNCVPGTPEFVNAVFTGVWTGDAPELLRTCQRIERALGRPARHSSRESRTIDLDILLFGTRTVKTAELQIPHPRMHERLFVLVPLHEVAADWPVPGTNGQAVETLCKDLLKRTGSDHDRISRLRENEPQ